MILSNVQFYTQPAWAQVQRGPTAYQVIFILEGNICMHIGLRDIVRSAVNPQHNCRSVDWAPSKEKDVLGILVLINIHDLLQ